jgi:hypothetical protein
MPEQFDKSFEIMRHGEKDPQGGLSEKGVAGIREYVRKDLIHQIENYPDGTVIVFFPSNIGRAKDTRTVFEDELGSLLEQDTKHYDTVNIQDVGRIKNFSGDKTKKFLIKDAGHQSLIGYKGAKVDPWIDEFSRRGKDFEGSDDMTGKLWLATDEEMGELKKEIAEKYPNVDQSDLKPSNFNDTPEHEAAEQIKWMLVLLEIANKHFPENPVKIFATSHNVLTDFAAIKLLDMPLTRTSLEELGGNVRGFLESHNVDIQGDKVVIRFRDKVNEFDVSRLEKILKELKAESEARKKMWVEHNL